LPASVLENYAYGSNPLHFWPTSVLTSYVFRVLANDSKPFSSIPFLDQHPYVSSKVFMVFSCNKCEK